MLDSLAALGVVRLASPPPVGVRKIQGSLREFRDGAAPVRLVAMTDPVAEVTRVGAMISPRQGGDLYEYLTMLRADGIGPGLGAGFSISGLAARKLSMARIDLRLDGLPRPARLLVEGDCLGRLAHLRDPRNRLCLAIGGGGSPESDLDDAYGLDLGPSATPGEIDLVLNAIRVDGPPITDIWTPSQPPRPGSASRRSGGRHTQRPRR